MKKVTAFFILLLSLSLLTSCSKSSTEPEEKKTDTGSGVPATETGAGTMGALIDGEKWQSSASGTSGAISTGLTIVVGLSAVSDGLNYTGHTFSFTIRGNAVGTYPLSVIGANTSYASYAKSTGQISSVTTSTYLTTLNAGSITITKYDAANKIVSGNFSFNASTAGDNPKTVAITAGVFDVKF